jgi:hypothetical protein
MRKGYQGKEVGQAPKPMREKGRAQRTTTDKADNDVVKNAFLLIDNQSRKKFRSYAVEPRIKIIGCFR